ncbi:hypothetical protein HAX54_007113, partial [Datura stramonium]|nr:hypothetical protein [Datura stramonium]
MALKLYQGSSDYQSDETMKVAFLSVSSGTFCQLGRFLVTRPGDINSENADMSNEKSYEKHDHLSAEDFLRLVNLRRVNRFLRNPRKGCRPMGCLTATEIIREEEGNCE